MEAILGQSEGAFETIPLRLPVDMSSEAYIYFETHKTISRTRF